MPDTPRSHIAGQWLGSTPDRALTSAVNGVGVARDVQVANQDGALVDSCDIPTLVATRPSA